MLKPLIAGLLLALLLIGCTVETSPSTSGVGGDPESKTKGEGSEPVELVLMTHDSFAISEVVLAEFEEKNNVRIVLLPAGDAGAALNQAILSKDDPLADLFFGVDNTFKSRSLAEGLFEGLGIHENQPRFDIAPGSGNNRKLAAVMTPRVPSLPRNRCFRS